MKFENFEIGATNFVEAIVTEKDTALSMKSGSLKVLATPKLICLVEEAAANLAEQFLPQEFTSVGTSLNINHKAPTPIGAKVHAEVELISVEGRKIIFKVVASDNIGEIFNGNHERFIVEREKFQAKADARIGSVA